MCYANVLFFQTKMAHKEMLAGLMQMQLHEPLAGLHAYSMSCCESGCNPVETKIEATVRCRPTQKSRRAAFVGMLSGAQLGSN